MWPSSSSWPPKSTPSLNPCHHHLQHCWRELRLATTALQIRQPNGKKLESLRKIAYEDRWVPAPNSKQTYIILSKHVQTLLHNITKHLHFWVSFILILSSGSVAGCGGVRLATSSSITAASGMRCCLQRKVAQSSRRRMTGPWVFLPNNGPAVLKPLHIPWQSTLHTSWKLRGRYVQTMGIWYICKKNRGWLFHQGSAKLKDKLSNCVTTVLGGGASWPKDTVQNSCTGNHCLTEDHSFKCHLPAWRLRGPTGQTGDHMGCDTNILVFTQQNFEENIWESWRIMKILSKLLQSLRSYSHGPCCRKALWLCTRHLLCPRHNSSDRPRLNLRRLRNGTDWCNFRMLPDPQGLCKMNTTRNLQN